MQTDFFAGAALSPLFSVPLTALTASYLLHIFVLGLITKHSQIVLTSDGDYHT